MTPPKNREQSVDLAVLSSDVKGLDRRVTKLEAEMEDREDSSEGIRRELADHRVEDAKVAAELKGAIGDVDRKVATVSARLGAMRWMLIVLIALGVINAGIVAFSKHDGGERRHEASAPQ